MRKRTTSCPGVGLLHWQSVFRNVNNGFCQGKKGAALINPGHRVYILLHPKKKKAKCWVTTAADAPVVVCCLFRLKWYIGRQQKSESEPLAQERKLKKGQEAGLPGLSRTAIDHNRITHPTNLIGTRLGKITLKVTCGEPLLKVAAEEWTLCLAFDVYRDDVQQINFVFFVHTRFRRIQAQQRKNQKWLKWWLGWWWRKPFGERRWGIGFFFLVFFAAANIVEIRYRVWVSKQQTVR